jgi:AAHS family 4-hydroxybenzoate transporter-like MFS transporter
MRPDLNINPGFTIATNGAEVGSSSMPIRQVFTGPFRYVTPLLWICLASNQMANYFSLTWLPTLLQSSGLSPVDASVAASFFPLGGLIGGLLLLAVIDRLGVIPMAILFLLGAPFIATMVLPGLPLWGYHVLIAGAGLCSMGVQLAVTALLGILYPTTVRSTGTGLAQAAGRIGALAAPVVGGALLAMNASPDRMTLAPAALFLVGAVSSTALAIICYRKLGTWRVDELSLENSR